MTTAGEEESATEKERGGLAFDPAGLRQKYREERDRRLRSDGNDQYVEVEGDFAHFLNDPYAQPGFTASYPHMLNEQAKHLAYIIKTGIDKELRSVEATEAAEAAWVERCIDKARLASEFFENCTPGYYNNEGKASERSVQDGFYGGGSIEFIEILEGWREDGTLPGLEER
jgi:hypothetical protein